MNAVRTLLTSLIVTPLLTLLLLLCTTSPLWASTPNSQNPVAAGAESRPVARSGLGESLLAEMRPRCELELARSNFVSGDSVLASWRILNPAPTRVNVEIKIWFTAPGQPPYSISNTLDGGQPVALPAALDEQTKMTELFAVDDETTRGIYEFSCRLIDPITGIQYSEDLNDFQVN